MTALPANGSLYQFSPDLSQLCEQVISESRRRGCNLVTAESCTGGLLSAALTDISGSSDVFEAGFITYANQAKETMLGIAPSLIRAEGAVSQKVALSMAHGALEASSASVAVALTGIAGPTGGSEQKPVGTVHIAVVSSQGRVLHQGYCFSGSRQEVRTQAAVAALQMILQALEDFALPAA